MASRIPAELQRTAPISAATVKVNGSLWPDKWGWGGFEFAKAEVRHRSIWGDDYHLRVPWMHPDDRTDGCEDDPDMWCFYRVRPKRGWRSFVKVNGEWHVGRAHPAAADPGEPVPTVTMLEITEDGCSMQRDVPFTVADWSAA